MEDCSIGQSAVGWENQTLEAFVAASRSNAKFDCPVACQYLSLLATAHDCETVLWSSLPFCLPSLTVQWPTSICHFYLLYMIVKLSYGTVFHSVCQVWLSSGLPVFVIFSYCAWLWNCLMEQSSILSAKFDCPVAHQYLSLLATAHDCETGLFIYKLPKNFVGRNFFTIFQLLLASKLGLFFQSRIYYVYFCWNIFSYPQWIVREVAWV